MTFNLKKTRKNLVVHMINIIIVLKVIVVIFILMVICRLECYEPNL